MQQIEILSHGVIKLNSYTPLCFNKIGEEAIKKYSYPPFIDSSCRREPDFQNENPSISALCRASKFAPFLRGKDIIVYMTKKGKYSENLPPHNRLVAILQVEEVYPSHEMGKIAYNILGLPTPSNCMVYDNPSYNIDQTAAKSTKSLQAWNNQYFGRAKKHPSFIRTKKLYLNLIDPKPIFESDLIDIFGKIPGTQNPKKISKDTLIRLAQIAEIEVVFL